MHSFYFTGSISSHTLLGLAIVVFVIIVPTLGATFNAKNFFLYIDQSCTDLDTINVAGDDMNALIEAGQDAIGPGKWAGPRLKTFEAFFGNIGLPDIPEMTIDDPRNSGAVLSGFEKLGTLMVPNKYALYCDGSALKWVTSMQEGDMDKPFDDGQGRWYIAANRRPMNVKAFYIKGTNREDYCQNLLGASMPGQPYVILCPRAFALPYKTLSSVKDTKQPKGTGLDDMTSIGAVMLHEFTHVILKLTANGEFYGASACISNAVKSSTTALTRKNADSFMLFAMASYLDKNDWTAFGLVIEPNPPNPPSRLARRRRLLDVPLYPRGNSTNVSPSGSAIGTFGTALSSSSSTTASEIFINNTPTSIIASSSEISSHSGPASSSKTGSGTASSSSSISATVATSSSSSTVNLSGSSGPTGAGLSSSSSSVLVPGSGILPFSTTTSSSSSEPSTLSLSFSGIWTDISTSTIVSFTWFDIPTGTIPDAAATSEAVFLGGLFFALQANRQWLTDPKLKSQYLDDVKKTQDEALALFNGLNVKPPEPDCSNTKRKRNTLSERQLRALLLERGIISSITGAIGDAVHDVAKLISCAVNVVKNLADSVEADVPDITEIENLTDTLAEIGKDLEDKDDTESSSSEGSSSTTSSCTASTAVPICTQTISFSTSYLSGGASSFTVATVTQNTCSTTTFSGCLGTGTTTTTTASADYDLFTEAILPVPTGGPIPTESLAWLSSVLANMYTGSISYASTTTSPTTSTVSGGPTTPSTSATEATSSASGPSFFGSILSGLFSVGPSSATAPTSAKTPSTSSTVAPPSSMAPPPSSAPPPTSRPPPAASPTLEAKFYFWHQDAYGKPAGNSWFMYLLPTSSFSTFSDDPLRYCEDRNGVFADAKIAMTDPLPTHAPWWPTGTFNLGGVGDNCIYTSDGTYPGILNCPGKAIVSCVEDANPGVPIVCDSNDTPDAVYPMVLCGLPN